MNSPDLSSLLRQVIPLAVFCIIHRACSISVNNSVCRKRAGETPHATAADWSWPWSCQKGRSQMDNKPTVKIIVSAHTLALEISENRHLHFHTAHIEACPEPWAGLSPHQIVCLRESLLVQKGNGYLRVFSARRVDFRTSDTAEDYNSEFWRLTRVSHPSWPSVVRLVVSRFARCLLHFIKQYPRLMVAALVNPCLWEAWGSQQDSQLSHSAKSGRTPWSGYLVLRGNEGPSDRRISRKED